jgi:hypothetical protein
MAIGAAIGAGDNMRLAAALVLLSAASAAAEPAHVTAAVNLRSGPTTDTRIVARIPAGSTVEVSTCVEWCAVEWQAKRGFAIAASLDRSGRVPARRAAKQNDLFATDIAGGKSALDMPRSGYEPPERYYGPYLWSYGPSSGPYRGTSGLGFRGRW